MKRISAYKKIIQEIALQTQKSPELIDQIIQNYYTNLSTQINLNKHYNIYIHNIGQLHLSPTKIRESIKYAIRDEKLDKVPILEKMLELSVNTIKEKTLKHRESMKINKAKYRDVQNIQNT